MSKNFEDIYEIDNYLTDIKKGDVIYVISDLSELATIFAREKNKFSMCRFVESLQNMIGKDGTLLFPTFNWNFREGKPYDYLLSKSQMGVLSQYVLGRSDFVRTLHPIHSFAVWGKYRKELTEMNPKNSFGKGTIFEFMYKKKAKALVIGLNSMEGMTFIHHMEKMVGVPYREEISYTGEYIDAKRNSLQKTYTMYTLKRDYEPEKINRFKNFSNITEQLNVSKNIKIEGASFSIVDIDALYSLLKIEFTLNDSRNLYHYKKLRDEEL